MAILDSGERTEFDSGAVRDMKVGKGRIDLMPLDVVANLMKDSIIEDIYKFQQDNSRLDLLYGVLIKISPVYNVNSMELTAINGHLDTIEVVEDIEKIKRARLANMFLDVSKHFEEGALKYGEDNWRKGIPFKSYIDSACRHYLKVLRGDTDEPHLRAFVWNIMCLIWTVEHKDGLF